MAKAKTKKESPNGQVNIQPWQIDVVYKKQVYEYLPAIFAALKSNHEVLEEIRDILKEQ